MNKKTSNHPQFMWLPLAMAACAVMGIFIGNHFSSKTYNAGNDRKINAILNLIEQNYVDTVNIDDLTEMAIPEILKNLDPHTVYFTKDDLKAADEELNGSFSGIGVQFFIANDTVNVTDVIPGGPSEKVGIISGDRIVSANDSILTGEKANQGNVMKQLRGTKGSKVRLGIKRSNSDKILYFDVTRGDIPMKSVDASYLLDKTTGYIKVNQFGSKTYDEFLTALCKLRDEGAKRYMIDLRGNGGGYMEMAILMANEFLAKNQPIVSTKGRNKKVGNEIFSDGHGQFQEEEVIVLIDEYSASASEIFAGAMQDNDRALIVGRRSFGKGLVQNQLVLGDSSAIRLTIARYYTPSGRCIQKDYKKINGYSTEVYDRYNNGEAFHVDSIKVDSTKLYYTAHQRKVYGGGGIIPDIFVPRDTLGINAYYIEIANAGLMQQYAFKYVDANRSYYKKMTDYSEFLRNEPSTDAILNNFVNFASSKDIPARWYYINQSRDLIVSTIKALVARDIFGSEAYYPIINRTDPTVQAAMKAFNKHKAMFPIESQDLDK